MSSHHQEHHWRYGTGFTLVDRRYGAAKYRGALAGNTAGHANAGLARLDGTYKRAVVCLVRISGAENCEDPHLYAVFAR